MIATIPRQIAEKLRVIPISKMGNVLNIALADPSDLVAIDSLTQLVGFEIHLLVASEADITAALKKYYAGANGD